MIAINIVGTLSPHSHPQIVNAAHQAIADLPRQIQAVLSPYKVLVGRRATDIKPQFANLKIRGHKNNFRHNHASMSPSRKEILVAQESLDSTGTYYRAVPRNRYHSFMHELGHAFDYNGTTKPTKSSRQEFIDAYKADIQRVKTLKDSDRSWDLQEKFSYFFDRQSFSIGRQQKLESALDEVFAEAFAYIVGGRNIDYDNREYQRDHEAVFRNCYALVEKIIREVAPDFEAFPERKRIYPKVKQADKVKTISLA